MLMRAALLISAMVTVPGAFPSPIVGAGAGPVLGFYAWLWAMSLSTPTLTLTPKQTMPTAAQGPPDARDTPPCAP